MQLDDALQDYYRFDPDDIPPSEAPTSELTLTTGLHPGGNPVQLVEQHIPNSLIINNPIVHTPWVIEDILVQEDFMILSGEGGSGKTYVLMEMAYALATGNSLFGHFPIVKPQPVIYIDLEMSRQIVINRFHRLYAGHGVTDPSQVSGIAVLSKENFSFDKDLAWLSELILRHGAKYILMDSISKFGLEDENKSAEASKVFNSIQFLRKGTGVGFVCIHHWNKEPRDPKVHVKPGGRLRGATAWRDNCDTHLAVEIIRKHTMKLTQDKARHSSEALDPFLVKFEHDDPENAADSPFRLKITGRETNLTRFVTLIKGQPGIDVLEAAKILNLSVKTLKSYHDDLPEGIIVKTKRGRKGETRYFTGDSVKEEID